MKVIMYPAVTLDGFIADPSGECYSWIDDEDEAEYTNAMRRCGCDIVGRKTYEQYKDEYAARTDIMTFVCTAGEGFKDTQYVKFVQGTPQEILSVVESHGFSEVILSGGGEINGLFANADCIDDIMASIYPVVLGEGIKLFGNHGPKLSLELINGKVNQKGIVQNHYRVIRKKVA